MPNMFKPVKAEGAVISVFFVFTIALWPKSVFALSCLGPQFVTLPIFLILSASVFIGSFFVALTVERIVNFRSSVKLGFVRALKTIFLGSFLSGINVISSYTLAFSIGYVLTPLLRGTLAAELMFFVHVVGPVVFLFGAVILAHSLKFIPRIKLVLMSAMVMLLLTYAFFIYSRASAQFTGQPLPKSTCADYIEPRLLEMYTSQQPIAIAGYGLMAVIVFTLRRWYRPKETSTQH